MRTEERKGDCRSPLQDLQKWAGLSTIKTWLHKACPYENKTGINPLQVQRGQADPGYRRKWGIAHFGDERLLGWVFPPRPGEIPQKALKKHQKKVGFRKDHSTQPTKNIFGLAENAQPRIYTNRVAPTCILRKKNRDQPPSGAVGAG